MNGHQIPKYIRRLWANLSYTDLIEMHNDQPIVSFTFDDAPRSAFNEAREILEKFGYRGTYYISLGFLDGTNGVSYTSEDLKTASDKGHELACHTRTHLDVSKSSIEEVKASVAGNLEQIQKIIPGYIFKNFSYPFGAQTVASKMHLAGIFKSARGNRHGINKGSIDRLNLKTIRLYENNESESHIRKLLTECIATNGWLIFYTHGVKKEFHNDGCSPKFFENTVRLVNEMNIRVRTVDEAIDEIIEKRFVTNN